MSPSAASSATNPPRQNPSNSDRENQHREPHADHEKEERPSSNDEHTNASASHLTARHAVIFAVIASLARANVRERRVSGYASYVGSRSRDAEYGAHNRGELRRMERNGGLYALAGIALGTGAYSTSWIPRYALAALAVLALLAGAWIGVWALGLTLLLRMGRQGR
jgi:hypothetical protein